VGRRFELRAAGGPARLEGHLQAARAHSERHAVEVDAVEREPLLTLGVDLVIQKLALRTKRLLCVRVLEDGHRHLHLLAAALADIGRERGEARVRVDAFVRHVVRLRHVSVRRRFGLLPKPRPMR